VNSLQTLVHSRSRAPRNAREEHGEQSRRTGEGELLLGRYRLLERLGSGGFAVVWRAHDEQLGREVALKRIPLPGNGEMGRATREAKATARLSHPAIVALYEAYAAEHEFYLISELIEGHTLKDLILAEDLSDQEIFQIGIALSDALSHAHSHGVIHRDVKPQNVLVPNAVGEDGPAHPHGAAIAKLADFGGARLTGEEALTLTGDVLGTLAYMAPEQSEGLQAGPEADLYSLALVLYEALSGVNPVRGATPAATARRLGEPIGSLRRCRRDLAPVLISAIDQALDPEPEDRGTISELDHALRLALQGTRSARKATAAPRERHLAPITEPRAHEQFDEDLYETPRWTSPSRWYQLPRVCWWACALAVIIWQASDGRMGVALLLAAGALPLAALQRRSSPSWVSAAIAPALGVIGLSGVYPAIAGQGTHWRERAALGALGYWWLSLAEPLSKHRLWLGSPPGTPARSVWESSLDSSAAHVIYPLLSLGVLLGCVAWALAACVLPWVVRGHSAWVDVIAATIWAAALCATEPLLDRGVSSHAGQVSPHGLVGSAILCGVLAIAIRAIRAPL
jgi:serine/threonine protein kinase